MKEYLLNQIQEKQGINGCFKLTKEKQGKDTLKEDIESKMKKKEQMDLYKQELDEQVKLKPDQVNMTETEKLINKKLLDKLNI
jgi:hypothetical protein